MINNQHTILIIDDDISLCTVVSHQLESMGYSVTVANDGERGLEVFSKSEYSLILLDLRMPGIHGMEVLHRIRLINNHIPIIIISAHGTVDDAIKACHMGADDYVTKPFAKEQLLFAIEKAVRFKQLENDNRRLRKELSEKFQFGRIMTRNKAMSTLLDMASRAANSDASVLLLGESGTGKELLARAIHQESPRRDKPFVAVNCPSIPESLIESELFGHEKGAFTGALRAKPGKFELAHEGTVFLDEIGDLKLDLQAKLLRVLQEQEIERVGSLKPIKINVRIIAATNQDLLQLVKNGQFREDLYYRLNVIPLSIPALRDRKDDIPLLVDYFVKKYATRELKVDPAFIEQLMSYDWPGNVRELENIVQRAIVLCPGETLECDFGEFIETTRAEIEEKAEGLNKSLEEIERQAIVAALNNNRNNQTRAAKELEIPRHVLIYRMKKMGIATNR